MKQNNIRTGQTYTNKGSGTKQRRVEALVPDSTRGLWYVRYSSEDGGGFVRLELFAAWAGLEVTDDIT